jgi:dienelactone hydrolase
MLRTLLSRSFPALALGLVLLPAALTAQVPVDTEWGRTLDHEDYDRWNRIGNQTISPDGRWIAWSVIPGGENAWATLHVQSVEGERSMVILGGGDPTFTDDSRFLVTLVEPNPEIVEERREAAEDDESVVLPQASLQVVDLESLELAVDIEDIDDFRVPEEGAAVVAMRMTEEEESSGDEQEDSQDEEAAEDDEDAGQPLLVVRLDGDRTPVRVEGVTSYAFTHAGDHLYYATNADADTDGVHRMDVGAGTSTTLLSGRGRYLEMTVSGGDDGTGAVAVLSDVAGVAAGADAPGMDVYVAGPDDTDARLLVEATHDAFPEGWGVSEHGNLRFSDAGTRVFFGTRPLPEPEPADDEDADEDEIDVEVDIWNWKDDYLQPMQLVQAQGYDERTWEAMARVDGEGVLQLEDELFENAQVADGGDGMVVLSRVSEPYRQLVSWDRSYYDYYLTDLESGATELVLEQVGGGVGFTPGDFDLVWWDGAEQHWFHMDRESGAVTNLTAGLPYPVHDELHDSPSDPGSYGSPGWTEDGEFVVYDRYDIWAVNPADGSARDLTQGVGRSNQIEFRYQRTEPGEYVPVDEYVYLSGFGELTKNEGFARDNLGDADGPERLVFTAHAYGNPQKAEDADRFLLTRSTFREFPDLYTTDGTMAEFTRHSDANPQQDEYRWGTAELYEWTSADGIPLQGILYKPDGFDPDEQYPMMVYFYERSSDGLHSYTTPSAGGSSINRAFYVSRGYLLFVPDIPYEIGFPGESASDAVIPGVLSLIDEGYVDAENIGVQGHSWGGYQISHMITRSDIFAAAEAGAPVVNMTSAYGGIRWASGMSRAFQYEKTQSRIGGTLWDSHQKFIENSPLFFADKINTPLLMMHNDEDGAVPWYQGIEMFSAMRRLGKPVWMLNYNGEAHGLRQEANQRDWAIRMQQFFDHYLMDAPAPVWLEEGVPATMKGKTLGLELMRPRLIGEEQQPEGAGSN